MSTGYAGLVDVFLGNGDGTFAPMQQYSGGSYSYGIASADFNGDGKPDLATLNFYGNSVSILLNQLASSTPQPAGGSGLVANYIAPVVTPTVTTLPVNPVITTSPSTPAISPNPPLLSEEGSAPNPIGAGGGDSSSTTSCPITMTLKLTYRGNQVKCLQTILNVKPIDGIFGSQTLSAVIAFQKAHGLKADGVVGRGTRALLNK